MAELPTGVTKVIHRQLLFPRMGSPARTNGRALSARTLTRSIIAKRLLPQSFGHSLVARTQPLMPTAEVPQCTRNTHPALPLHERRVRRIARRKTSNRRREHIASVAEPAVVERRRGNARRSAIGEHVWRRPDARDSARLLRGAWTPVSAAVVRRCRCRRWRSARLGLVDAREAAQEAVPRDA